MPYPEVPNPENQASNLTIIAEAVVERNRLWRARREERAFTASVLDTVGANGGTVNLHLKNPADGTVVDVHELIIRTQFQGEFRVYDTFSSAPSGGSDVQTENLLLDSGNGTPDEGNALTNTNVSFTADGTHFRAVLPGGSANGQLGGEANATEPLIDSGREIVVEVTNTSKKENKASIAVTWAERTPKLVE